MAVKPVISPEEIENGLRAAGLSAGNQVIVHTSLGSLGCVCGGAQTVIEAHCHGKQRHAGGRSAAVGQL